MDRLKQHVERFMDDLVSLLKITDPTAWEAGKEIFECSVDRDQLAVDYLIGQPVILQNISQRALCAAGFSESSFVQRISNGGYIDYRPGRSPTMTAAFLLQFNW